MSNYPPGVSGNEYEIAGPDFERDEPRTCGAQGSYEVLLNNAQHRIRAARVAAEVTPGNSVQVLQQLIHQIDQLTQDILTISTDSCPWDGIVTVAGYRGEMWWSCPLCGHNHQETA